MVNIFIANLDWSITSDDLKATFSSFGKVEYAHVVFDKETKKSRGFGYVEMEDTEAAIAAIQALNGMEINGRNIDVKIASPKGNRPEKKPVVQKPFKKDGFKKEGYNKNPNFQKREFGVKDASSQERRVLRPRRNSNNSEQ